MLVSNSAGLDLPYVHRTWLCQSKPSGMWKYVGNWSITNIVFKVLLTPALSGSDVVVFNLI